MKKYYQLLENDRKAEIFVYGDITSWPWLETDVSSFLLSQQIARLDVDEIHVYINSYGGEVKEGLAIHSELLRHQAKVYTYCDGFACSSAATIFSAGDYRIMGIASLLMIHNASTGANGTADELRKAADDVAIITEASIKAYMRCVNIAEDELRRLMNEETWILPEDAVNMGFATSVAEQKPETSINQSFRQSIINKLTGQPTVEPQKLIDVDAVANIIIEKLEEKISQRQTEKGHSHVLQFFKAISQEEKK